LANVSEPDWMLREHQLALKAIQTKEFPKAIASLRRILEDGKARPVQVTSQKLLMDLEGLGQERLARAKDLFDRGQIPEAVDALNDTLRTFPSLQVAKDGNDMLTRISQSAEMRNQTRNKRAQELLAQAQEFYKLKDYIPCLDRIEILMASYGDLTEGQEASQISANIKSDPEWLQSACEVMGDRLGNLYLSLAESLLRKGQPDRARFYLERVVRSFPGTRQAESAQIRLGQLAGMPARRVEIESVNNRP
jgi:tetratricopeptide (TPR) repeat protein